MNYMQQPMQNPKDISDLTTAIDMTLALMAKVFTLNNTTPTNNNQRSSSNPSNMQIAQPGMNMDQDRHMLMVKDNIVENINGLSVVSEIANEYGNRNVVKAPAEGNGNLIRCYNCQGLGHYASNCTVKPKKRDAAYLQQQLQIAKKEKAGIQSTQEEFEFIATADAYEETKRVKASTSGTQSDKSPVYNSDGLAEVSSVEQGVGTVEEHPANVEETRALYDSLCNNLAIEVEKFNTVNRKLRETNAYLGQAKALAEG
uniref:CCHC-type domain-containing protein n=1 Tax=Tanacetum cinerariifolium TaxID=118510 RepID=A0A699GIF1_TANCI|nr:hypothetical protein [Tanacetum cinerariifolium]